MPQKLQLLAHEQAIGGVIVDHQNIQGGGTSVWICASAGLRHLFEWQGRQVQRNLDLSADTRLAAQLQAAAHHFAQIAADHQAQPRTASG